MACTDHWLVCAALTVFQVGCRASKLEPITGVFNAVNCGRPVWAFGHIESRDGAESTPTRSRVRTTAQVLTPRATARQVKHPAR